MNRSKAGDRLRLLTVFIAAVDAGSFAAAARRLGVSPATVTRAIAELELQLGARVLTRTTRTIRLTEAGSRYAENCRQILRRLEDAEATVRGLQRAPQEHLTIAASSSLGRGLVVPIVTRYLRRFPETGATCVYFDRARCVADDGIDVAIRMSAAASADPEGMPVGLVRQVICASPSYLRLHPPLREPADLRAHHIIGGPWTGTHVEWQLKQPGHDGPTRLMPRLVTNDVDATVRLVSDGVGLAQVHLTVVQGLLSSGALVTVLDDHEPEPGVLRIQHREGRHSPAMRQAFIDMAVESLRRGPGVSPLLMGLRGDQTAHRPKAP